MEGRRSKARAFARAHWAVLLPAVAYLWLFPYLPALRSPNELCRLHQARALVDHGSVEISRVLASEGWVGDLSCVALARDPSGAIAERRACPAVKDEPGFREKRYYPSKAPLLSFAAVPVYAVLRALRGPEGVSELALVYFARLFVTVLPAVLLLIPLRRFLRAYLPDPLASALTGTYALGTLAFSYAELFMSHQTAAVLVFLCFYALFRLGRGEWPRWAYAVAGLLAGLAVAAEYTAALALPALAVYALWTAPGGARGKLRAAALGLAGVLPAALALAAYHQAAFGHPLHSGYKYLNDAAYQGWHVGGFLGIRLPEARAFLLSFFSPLRGLFVLSPFLLLALPGFGPRSFARGADEEGGSRSGLRPALGVSLALLLLYAYFTSSFSYDSWGWTTGPRHLTPLVPFLLLPAGLFLERHQGRWLAGAVAAGLAVLSILSTSAMTLLNYIPDSLTNALHQVALPFATRGYLPHSALSLAGVPNPWAALPGLLAIVATAACCAHALLPPARRLASMAVALGVAVGLSLAHASIRPSSPARAARDQGTYHFLEERYLPRPGEASPALWKR